MQETSEPDKQLMVEVLLTMYETRYMLAKQAEDQRATRMRSPSVQRLSTNCEFTVIYPDSREQTL